MKKQISGRQSGFTLIEVLVVIGIIAVLAGIVLIAINPARQFAQARNSQRTSNVNTILNAIGQRVADNKGLFPTAAGCDALVAGTTYTIAEGTPAPFPIAPATAIVDLSCLVPTYISAGLPFDPSLPPVTKWTSATDYNTGYNVMVDSNGRYTVSAPTPEPTVGNAPITITR